MPLRKRKNFSTNSQSTPKDAVEAVGIRKDEIGSNEDASGERKRHKSELTISTLSTLPSETFDSKSKTRDGRPWNFKISSWNVSGVRAWIKKGGLLFLQKENPNILVLQETKCGEALIPPEAKNFPGYYSFWSNEGSKRGYAGVGLFTKQEPIAVTFGLGNKIHDNEARILTAEYDNFYVVAIYNPNSGAELVRLPYRRVWNKDVLAYLNQLDKMKPVICAGDLNVAHNPIDLARPERHENHACFTKEEREDFTILLHSGFVDTFRHLYPSKTDSYSFWSYRFNARATNIGWRLDYILLSERLVGDLCDMVMRKNVTGSDHCPITAFMSF